MTGKHVYLLNIPNTPLLYAPKTRVLTASIPRCFSTSGSRGQQNEPKTNETNPTVSAKDESEEDSPMSRRLSEMTEEAMLEGGQSARRNMQQAGFSEDLKKQLEERIAASSFQSDYAAAHSIVNMPV
jgi:hypothetical protein